MLQITLSDGFIKMAVGYGMPARTMAEHILSYYANHPPRIRRRRRGRPRLDERPVGPDPRLLDDETIARLPSARQLAKQR